MASDRSCTARPPRQAFSGLAGSTPKVAIGCSRSPLMFTGIIAEQAARATATAASAAPTRRTAPCFTASPSAPAVGDVADLDLVDADGLQFADRQLVEVGAAVEGRVDDVVLALGRLDGVSDAEGSVDGGVADHHGRGANAWEGARAGALQMDPGIGRIAAQGQAVGLEVDVAAPRRELAHRH